MRTRQSVKAKGQQSGMSLIGMLLVMIMIGLVAVVAMQVFPMYSSYLSIKSTIETVRKESVAQMAVPEIQAAIQKRFDIGYVEVIKAKDIKIRNDRSGKVAELVYNDERELCCMFYITLKVNETIPLQ